MGDLFPISIEEMIKEIDREIALRRRVYPKWVEARKMTQEKADRQIAIMTAISNELMKRLTA